MPRFLPGKRGNTMYIKDDIKYIGVNDKRIDLFESMFPVPNGMAYNSYVVLDDKIAVIDTMEQHFRAEWEEKLEEALSGRKPDYLIVHHMEPDHSANIKYFLDKYPEAKVAASKQAFNMMQNFFGTNFADRQIVLADGSEIELGKHKLRFVTAQMVHWPEVVMSYIPDLKLAFTADAFGKFGALDSDEPWDDEARRYYCGIVGKFGVQVQNLFKKLSALEIETICSTHGPVLTGDLSHYFDLYNKWSSYTPEEDGVLIAFSSVYEHTKEAVFILRDELDKLGVKNEVYDISRCDKYQAVAKAFQYSKMVLATTTYYGDMFPTMRIFIRALQDRLFKNRKVAFIENGTWAAQAAAKMQAEIEPMGLEILPGKVTIKSSVTEENKAQLAELAKALA